jgi:uncharacterized protein (TIGR03083 family)
MTVAAIAALRTETERASALFTSLSPAEWQMQSGCDGWRVQDVVQHMASVFHQITDPSSIPSGDSPDVEQNAEVPVGARKDWTTAQVIAEYTEWAEKGVAALAALQEEPLASTVIPLANLGAHPMHLLGNAIVFDHYCHLRHDIGHAVERARDLPHDADALTATMEWMLGGLPQMCAPALKNATAGFVLTIHAPASQWTIQPGDPLWTVTEGATAGLPEVTTTAHNFVSWGTKRSDWRSAVSVDHDSDAVDVTLDAINII